VAEFPILLDEAEPQPFAQGEVIFRAGDAGDVMYAVREGQVSILIGEREVEIVGPKGLFGELALIDDEPRSATAVAKTPCQVVPIDRSRFEHLVERWPGFALSVMKLMADRIRRRDRA
jgi:CRP/FNR family transcriptional regulator, cyclic AMP receptor protein